MEMYKNHRLHPAFFHLHVRVINDQIPAIIEKTNFASNLGQNMTREWRVFLGSHAVEMYKDHLLSTM